MLPTRKSNKNKNKMADKRFIQNDKWYLEIIKSKQKIRFHGGFRMILVSGSNNIQAQMR